jgi:uncharacterized membrane protein YadS
VIAPHDRVFAALIAVSTSICGITAIVAAAPVIRAREVEVSYAVACIALFGLIAMFTYPLLAHTLFSTRPQLAGIFLGTAVHDTSQVVGAALMYQNQYSAPGSLEAATVTKLVRNLLMAVVIPCPVCGAERRRFLPARIRSSGKGSMGARSSGVPRP